MSNNAFALKSQMIPLTVIELTTLNNTDFDKQLTETVQASPALFDRMPAILGLEAFEKADESDIQKLLFTIRKHNILPVAIKGAEFLKDLAQTLDLAWIPPGRNKLQKKAQQEKEGIEAVSEQESVTSSTDTTNTEMTSTETASDTTQAPNNQTSNTQAPQQLELTESPQTPDKELEQVMIDASHSSEESQQASLQNLPTNAKIITTPVRSGQQVYAKGTDLIVLTQVGQGAEVIADGNIHIYGTLRGRAIAGASGNPEARIFCQSLQAELISIAGIYQVSDDLPSDRIGQSCQIELKENHLHIDTL